MAPSMHWRSANCPGLGRSFGVLAIGGAVWLGSLSALAHELPEPPEPLDEKLWEELAASPPNHGRLFGIFKVWEDGHIESLKGPGGSYGPWEPVIDPLASGSIYFEIGNPKFCYVTSGGDMRCINY
jgi:hypothetical protein